MGQFLHEWALALCAPLGALPLHRRQGVSAKDGISDHEGIRRVFIGLGHRKWSRDFNDLSLVLNREQFFGSRWHPRFYECWLYSRSSTHLRAISKLPRGEQHSGARS